MPATRHSPCATCRPTPSAARSAKRGRRRLPRTSCGSWATSPPHAKRPRHACGSLEPLKPETDGLKRFLAANQADCSGSLALAAYALKDYVTAEAAARRGTEFRKQAPPQNRVQKFFEAELYVRHAMALAKLGRQAEARTALLPVLELDRKLPDVGEAEWVRERRAAVRLAQALANPGEARALLAEAAALMDGLTIEHRRLATTLRLRNEIALEQASRR